MDNHIFSVVFLNGHPPPPCKGSSLIHPPKVCELQWATLWWTSCWAGMYVYHTFQGVHLKLHVFVTHLLSGWPKKSSNFIFTTKMVFPKSLKFMNSGSEVIKTSKPTVGISWPLAVLLAPTPLRLRASFRAGPSLTVPQNSGSRATSRPERRRIFPDPSSC